MPHIYVHSLSQCCFHSLISSCPNLSENVNSGQLCRDKECPFSGKTNCSRVWRKVLKSDARSVRKSKSTRQKNERIGDRKRESNDSPEIPDLRETYINMIPGLYSRV